MTDVFSLTVAARVAWLSFLASLACCRAILKSCDTLSCRDASVFSSNFLALGTCACADLLPLARAFLAVSTSSPARRAAFTTAVPRAALPVGPAFFQTVGSQSCAACRDGPLGILAARAGEGEGKGCCEFL